MATYYVDSDTGDDANSGASPEAPKKTLAAGVALMGAVSSRADTLYVRGTFRNEWVTLSGLSNKTIERWPGAEKPKLTHRLVSGSWTHIGASVYTATIGTGLSLSSLTFGWGQAASVTGGYYGFCRRESTAAAVTAAASGGKGRYHYDSATGLITAYFGGANPNTAGKEIGYATTETADAAFLLLNSPSCTIRGFVVGPMPKHTGQYGWAVRCQNSPGTVAEDIEGYDLGAHAFGTLGGSGNNSGCRFTKCVSIGLSPTGTHLIAHQVVADGAYVGAVFHGCTVVTGRWRGIDDLVLDGRSDAAGSLDGNTQIAAYGHADSGTGINFACSGCVFRAAETGSRPWAIDHSAAATLGDRTSYPLKISDSTISGFEGINISPGGSLYKGHWRADRCAFSTSVAASTGFSAGGIFFNFAAPNSDDYFIEFESCTFAGSLDGGGATRMFSGQASGGGTKRMRFVNCSFLNTGSSTSQFCGFFDCLTESRKYFEAFGCIFAHKVLSIDNCIYLWDSAAALAGNPIRDGLYFNVTGTRFAHIAAYSAAQWVANVDDAAVVSVNMLAASPYADQGTLEPTAAVYAMTRALGTFTALSGINGVAYVGDFGAWQGMFRRRIPPRVFRMIQRGVTVVRRRP